MAYYFIIHIIYKQKLKMKSLDFFCFIRLHQRVLLLNWCDFQVIKMIQKNILAQLNHQVKYKIIQTVSLPNVPGKKTK